MEIKKEDNLINSENHLTLNKSNGWILTASPSSRPYWNLASLRFGLGRSARPPRISADVYEVGNEVFVTADIPGVLAEDIAMKIKGNTLTIFGAVQPEHNQEEGKFFRMERAAGTFSKHVVLPARVDEDDIDAVVTHGVLTVRLQKKPEQAFRPRSLSFV